MTDQRAEPPIIYLDQCHLSRMAKARLGRSQDPDELALFNRLDSLVQQGLVVVPYSFWHVIETSAYEDDEGREALCAVVGTLSQGRCLRFCHDIVAEEAVFAISHALVGTKQAAPSPLGHGLGCYPVSSIHDLTNAYVLATPAPNRFREIIDLSRRTSVRELHARFQQTLWTAEKLGAVERNQRRVGLDTAREAEAASLHGDDLVNRCIDRAADELALPRHVVRELVVADRFRRVPGLAAMVEIRARRDVQYGMNPKASDVTDAGHLLVLPHVAWFLTDRKAAAIARDAGKPFGARVEADPAALVLALDHR